MSRKRLPIDFATSDMDAGHLEAIIARTREGGHSAQEPRRDDARKCRVLARNRPAGDKAGRARPARRARDRALRYLAAQMTGRSGQAGSVTQAEAPIDLPVVRAAPWIERSIINTKTPGDCHPADYWLERITRCL